MNKKIALISGAVIIALCAVVVGVVVFTSSSGNAGADSSAPLAGLHTDGDNTYYYAEDGTRQTGWQTINGNVYYFEPTTGAAARGWYTDADGETYYFGQDGYAMVGTHEIEGESYTFGSDGKLVEQLEENSGYEWQTIDGETYCYGPDGELVVGLAEIGNQLYYFDQDGVRQQEWHTIDGNIYYFNPTNGRAAIGWAELDGKTYYFGEDGYALVGEQTINGRDYTFNSQGHLQQNTSSGGASSSSQSVAVQPAEPTPETPQPQGYWEGTKYMLPSGVYATGAVAIDGSLYGFDETTGEMLLGRQEIDGRYYNFDDESGKAQTGWIQDENDPSVEYYYSSQGPALTSLQTLDDGKKYYFDPATGAVQTGLLIVEGKVYYFAGERGAALTGWHEVSQTPEDTNQPQPEALMRTAAAATPLTYMYYFDDSDAYALVGVHQLSDGKVYGFSDTGVQLTGWQDMAEGRYLFDGENGSAVVNTLATHTDGEVYLGEDGKAVSGLLQLEGKTYYFNIGGIRQQGWFTVDGATYCFEGEGDAALLSQWRQSTDGMCYLGADGKAYTGLQQVSGGEDTDGLYYFAANGVRQTGRHTIEGQLYFFDTNGKAISGWHVADGASYYLGGDGYALTGLQSLEGAHYYFNLQTAVRESGWQTINGKKYMFDAASGAAVIGEYSEGAAWYLFGADGAALTGVQPLNGKYYFYNAEGIRTSGWQTYNGSLYYFGEDDFAARHGWFTDYANSAIYYFDNSGKALVGSHDIEGNTYVFDQDGRLTQQDGEDDSGWVTVDGNTFYVGSSGNYVVGLHAISGSLYYFDQNGVRQSGWVTHNSKYYYFDAENDSKAVVGWFTEGEGEDAATYFFGSGGDAVTGIRQIEQGEDTDGLYYFDETTAKMQTGEVVIAGARYYFDAENGGAAASGWYPSISDDTARYYDTETHIAYTGMQLIEGDGLYLFDDTGLRKTGWHRDENGFIYYFSTEDFKAVTGSYTAEGQSYFFTEDGYALVGLQRLPTDNLLHYFNNSGAQQTGWQRLGEGKRYYFSTETGAALVGEHTIEGDGYYFHLEEAFALTGSHEIDGRTYVFDIDGKILSKEATTGFEWQTIDGVLYYINSAGEALTTGEIHDIGGYLYSFNTDGSPLTGRQTIAGSVYLFAADGKAVIGWHLDGENAYYFDSEGKMYTGEQEIAGVQYVFDEDGVLIEGDVPVYNEWITLEDGGTAYYDSTGKLAIGLHNIAGDVYFFNQDGAMQTGHIKVADEQFYYFDEQGAAVAGWVQIEERWYSFDQQSRMQQLGWQYRTDNDGATYTHYFDPQTGQSPEGWSEVNGAYRYFYADGHMAIGWATIDEEEYYFFQNGERASGVVTIGGQFYSFDADGKLMNNTWNTDAEGNRYYFQNGIALTGWQQIDGRWYRFNEDAHQLTGWQYRSEGNVSYTFFYNSDGSLPPEGEQLVGGINRYFFADGHMAVGWNTIDEKLYHFATNGEMSTGLTHIAGVPYPFSEDGMLELGWYTNTADSSRYYYTTNGAQRGWAQIDGVWYMFSESDATQQTGWQTREAADGTSFTHHFANSGEATIGWHTAGGKTYYFHPDATMATGWVQIESDGTEYTHYFYPADGSMAVGAVVIDGSPYSFDANGRMSEGWNTDAEGNRYYFGQDGALKGWQQIDSRWYNFDATTGAQQLGWQIRYDDVTPIYYFYSQNGELPTEGWNNNIDGARRYVLSDGRMASGIVEVDGSRMGFTAQGEPLTGWQQIDERWYHFDENGEQLTGWQQRVVNSSYTATYYYSQDGSLPIAGWHEDIEDERRYVMEDGELANGWLTLDTFRYYFDDEGVPYTGQHTINGESFNFDEQGRLVSPPIITNVEYDTGWDSTKTVTISATANSILEDSTILYSFDGGATWQAENSKEFAAGTTIAANTLQVKDSAGNISSYGTVITLEDAFTRSHGIDVSAHQGYIDWAAVAASGEVDYAIIRSLTWDRNATNPYTGESGYYIIDPTFDYNVRQAKANGIDVGTYLYSYAFNDAEMIEEVLFFMNSSEIQGLLADGIYFDLPVFIDYEDPLISTNTANQTITQRTETLRLGMAIIEQESNYLFRPGFYVSRSWATSMVDAVALQNMGYDLWLAHWGITAHGWSPTPALWQYNNGEYFNDPGVPGISGRVDRNWLYLNYDNLIDGGNQTAPDTGGGSEPVTYNLTVTNQHGQVVTGTADQIISQIVMAEVGGFNNAEVYKAQAVAALSWVIDQHNKGYAAPNVALTTPTSAVTAAVNEVIGEVLTYNGSIIMAPYFAYSNGFTNDARYWNAANNLPYLVTVPSSYDTTVKTPKTITISETELRQRLINIYGTDITQGYAPQDWIRITSTNSGGYVTGVSVCGRNPTVDYFIIYIAGIGSPSFNVSYSGGVFSFTYSGYGHGIGMSQYGAYGLALQGYDYTQILSHFYQGTTISNIF